MQIVDYTRVSKKEANSKMFVPSISHSQFLKHQLGWFLGTVDVRKGSELEAECSLKFFEWSDVQSKYRLGAQVCLLLRVHVVWFFVRQEHVVLWQFSVQSCVRCSLSILISIYFDL